MNDKNTKLAKGVIWSAVDKIAVVSVLLLLEVILAKNLIPDDYTILGIAMVFVAFGIIFSEGGFLNALIQNQNRSEKDFCTAFYFNFFISSIFSVLLFFAAPYLSNYFKIFTLTDVLRCLTISIIFNSLTMVFKAKLSIDMDFKTQTIVTLLSLIISGSVGVILAYNAFGIWALISQIILQSVLSFFFYIITIKWYPKYGFSIESFKRLFNFGGNVLLAGIIQGVYSNSYNVLIGKQMPGNALGYYSKSNQFTGMPSNLLSGVLQRVLFPYFSTYQNDNDKIFQLNIIYTKFICFFFFPIFVYLCVFAKPLVFYGLSENWMGMVEIVQLLSIAYLFQPIIVNNMFILQVKNKTRLFFWVECLTKVTGFIILLISIKFGIIWLCYGLIAQLVIQFLITSFFSHLVINENLIRQVLVVFFNVFLSLSIWFFIEFLYGSKDMLEFLYFGTLTFLLIYAVLYYFILKKQIVEIFSIFKAKNKL